MVHSFVVHTYLYSSYYFLNPEEKEGTHGGGGGGKREGGCSIGGIVAGVAIPFVLLTVVAVVEVIAGVWLWRRYTCTVYITLARVDLIY